MSYNKKEIKNMRTEWREIKNRIKKLKKIENELKNINYSGFESEKEKLKKLLKNPNQYEEAKKYFEDLMNKINLAEKENKVEKKRKEIELQNQNKEKTENERERKLLEKRKERESQNQEKTKRVIQQKKKEEGIISHSNELYEKINSRIATLKEKGIETKKFENLLNNAKSSINNKKWKKANDALTNLEANLIDFENKYEQIITGNNEIINTSNDINIKNRLKENIVTIERTIYDPISSSFLTSKPRNLPNITRLINEQDCFSYWYILCLKNNSDKTIDEWGVLLNLDKTIKITDIYIEKINKNIDFTNSFDPDKYWRDNYLIRFTRHEGIVIPRDGSLKIFYKLIATTCNIHPEINGFFETEDNKEPEKIKIKTKKFHIACDSNTYRTAFNDFPYEAERFTEKVLSIRFDKYTTTILHKAYRNFNDLKTCCDNKNYNDLCRKMNAFHDLMEKSMANTNICTHLQNTINEIKIVGDNQEIYGYVKNEVIPELEDLWENEILHI